MKKMSSVKARLELDKCKGEEKIKTSLSFFSIWLFEEMMSAASSCKHEKNLKTSEASRAER